MKKRNGNYFKALFKAYDVMQPLLIGMLSALFLFAVNYFRIFDHLSEGVSRIALPLYDGFIVSVFAFVYGGTAFKKKKTKITVSDFLLLLGFFIALFTFIFYVIYHFQLIFILFYLAMMIIPLVIMLIRFFIYDETMKVISNVRNYYSTIASSPKIFISIGLGIIAGIIVYILLTYFPFNSMGLFVMRSLAGVFIGFLFCIILDSIVGKREVVNNIDYLIIVLLIMMVINGAYFVGKLNIRSICLFGVALFCFISAFTIRSIFYAGAYIPEPKRKINRYYFAICQKFHMTFDAILAISVSFLLLLFDVVNIRNYGNGPIIFLLSIGTILFIIGLLLLFRNIKSPTVTHLDYFLVAGDLFFIGLLILILYHYSIFRLLITVIYTIGMVILTLVRVSIFEKGVSGVINSLSDYQEVNPYDEDEYEEYKERKKKRSHVKQDSYLYPSLSEDSLFSESESDMDSCFEEEAPIDLEPAMEVPDQMIMELEPITKEEDRKEFVFIDKKMNYQERFNRLNEDSLSYYQEIKKTLLRYRTQSRISANHETFRIHGIKALIRIVGKTLRLYLALDPQECPPQVHATDVSNVKQYQSVPCLIKIKSHRTMVLSLQMIEKMMSKAQIKPYLSKEEDENQTLDENSR